MSSYFDQLAQTWDQNPMKIERAKATADQCLQVPLHERKSLLDIGGGTGTLSIFLRDHFDAITIADTSSEMLKVAREKITGTGVSNIETLLLRDDISEITSRYSAIITLMTLHHIADIDAFLGSVTNLLDDQGTLMIADLTKEDGSFHKHVEDFDGHNGFEPNELTKRLEGKGFEVTCAEQYFEIEKENSAGEKQAYPLFFMAAKKR